MHITDWMERVDLRKEMQEVYLHSFLFKLGIRLVSIFLPFYILELGFGISTVFVFFIIYYSTYIFFSWPNSVICSRFGYKHTMLIASPFILLFYLALRAVESEPLLYGVGILGGTAFNLYYMGMNPEVSQSSDEGSREKDTGFFYSMPSLASILSPIVGGLILAVFNFGALFLTSASIIGASFLPFLLTEEHYKGLEINFKQYLVNYSSTDFLTYYFKGFQSMGKKVLWPAYLAVIIGGSLNIGGAGSFRALGSALTSVAIGSIVNEENRKKVILTAVLISALTYMAMSVVTTPITAFAVSLANGLVYTAASIPIYSSALSHAEHEDLIEYFAVREVALSLGRISAISLFIGSFAFLEGQLRFIASFGALSVGVLLVGYFGSRM